MNRLRSFERNPRSVRRAANQLQLSRMSVWRDLKKNGLYPYPSPKCATFNTWRSYTTPRVLPNNAQPSPTLFYAGWCIKLTQSTCIVRRKSTCYHWQAPSAPVLNQCMNWNNRWLFVLVLFSASKTRYVTILKLIRKIVNGNVVSAWRGTCTF